MTLWEEQISADKQRSYATAPHAANPPTTVDLASSKSTTPKKGVSLLSLNTPGTLLATKSDATSTTAWIWSLQTGKPVAVLIHHSPIKALTWHPSQPDLLMIHCAIPDPTLHFWKKDWDPLALALPLANASGSRLEANWLASANDDTFALMLSSATNSVIVELSRTGELILPKAQPAGEREGEQHAFKCSESGPEDMFDEGESLNFSPVRFDAMTAGYGSLEGVMDGDGMGESAMVEDTFDYRKPLRVPG